MIDANEVCDISFCLPVYNVCSFLDDCLNSILKQKLESYNVSYEIFFIDDGSRDGSYEWLLDRAKNVPWLRVERNDANRGVSYTRNRLMKEARGRYIWYVDPDDMLIGDSAIILYNLAEKYKADVMLGNYIRVAENSTFGEEWTQSSDINEVDATNVKWKLPSDTSGKQMCSVCGGLFLKDFLLKNNLLMNEKMIAQEDTLFYYEFSLKSQRIYKCDAYCYLYRQRMSSVMHSHSDERSKKYYLSMLEMLRVYRKHLETGDFDDKAVLERKIHHSKQNVAQCLASVRDKKYIKEQFVILKKEKIYPYKFRKAALDTRPFYLGALTFMLPLKPFFWLYHFVYLKTHKKA